MSASRTLRAMPTLLRVGVAETVAYRGEFLVWILTTTQPLIMMALWTAVARDGSFGGYTAADFTAYYLATLIVRQLTGNWVAWQMSEEMRSGALSMRLLRPIHPFYAYAASHIAAIPFRSAIALPLIVILLVTSGGHELASDPLQLAAIVPSLALAWFLTFMMLFVIGCLSFWMTQTFAIANLYFGAYSLLSGYLLPLSLLPGVFRTAAAYSPFRFMQSAPVELMTRDLSHEQVGLIVGGQLAWAAVLFGIALVVWRAGVRRFEAVGG
ncbi:MAG: ABC transporter permease [Acidobacteriota bacterium]